LNNLNTFVKRLVVFKMTRGTPPGGLTGGNWEARKDIGWEAGRQGDWKAGKRKGRETRKHQEFDRFLMRYNLCSQFSASQPPGFLASQLIRLPSENRLKHFDDGQVRKGIVGTCRLAVDQHHADVGPWNSQISDQCRRIDLIREFQFKPFFMVIIP
jgi:hypothetical protein